MEHRDPYALIERTATGLRRRRLLNAFLPWLAPAAVLAGFAAVAGLRIELAVAVALLAAVLLVDARAAGPGARQAASRLDEKTDGRDHFLTLATGTLRPPMAELVEAGAQRLGEGIRPHDVLPPLAWRGFAWGAVGAAILAAILALAPATFSPAPGPAERLEAIADELSRAGGEEARDLARELRAAAAVLADPDASSEERRRAIEKALQKLDSQGRDEDGGGEGAGGPGEAQTSGSGELRGEARSALEQASASTSEGDSGSGRSTDGESESGAPEESGAGEKEPSGESGGGLDAPRPQPSGAKEREGEAEGSENRPDDSTAKSAESRGGAGEGREPKDPDRPGPGEAGGPDPSAGSASGGTAPSPESAEGAGNPELPGEGPGWRIVDGRYVRVRVPEGETDALETERVRGPGEVVPATPFANAPLPGEGPAGEPLERQPLPLEYRNVLTGKDSR